MADDYRSFYSTKNSESIPPSIDEYGFLSSKESSFICSERSDKVEWYDLIDKYEGDFKRFREIVLKKRLLQKGIPLALKSRIWMYFLNSSFYKTVNQKVFSSISNFVQLIDDRKKSEKYQKYISKKSKYDYQIHVDIQRTFRNHYMFYETYGKGQSELFNVLVAFSNNFTSIGYCQGISEIGALLIMHYPEEQAYEMLCSLIKKNKLEKLFDKNLTKIPILMKLQRSLFYSVIPDTILYLEKNAENHQIYFIGWYITLFTRFNIKMTLRIWDYLMFYGFNILIYFAAAILKVLSPKILNCRDENLIRFLNNVEKEDIDETIVVDMVVKFLEQTKYQYMEHKYRIG